MITLTREEAQQVLDAFVNWDARGRLRIIEALRARLAQPNDFNPDWDASLSLTRSSAPSIFESTTGLRRGFILHKIMQNNL